MGVDYALVGPRRAGLMEDVARTMGFVAAGGAVVLMILPHTESLAYRVVDRVPAPKRVRDRIKQMIEQVLLGIRAFHHVSRFAGFAGLTAVIWLCDATGMIVSARGLGLLMGYPAAVLLMTAMGLGSALPSTP